MAPRIAAQCTRESRLRHRRKQAETPRQLYRAWLPVRPSAALVLLRFARPWPHIVVPAIPAAAAPTQKPAGWVSGILAPAISSWAVQSVRWLRAPERRTELRAAFSRGWRFACRTASASATYLNSGWQRLAQTTRTQARCLEERRQSVKASRTKRVAERASWALTPDAESALGHQVEMITRVDVPDIDAIAEPMRDIGPITIDVAGAAHLSDGRVLRNDFASAPDRTIGTIRQPDEPAAPSREAPFELRPLPWVLGALSPVISSRTLMMHHGSHYAQCVESANRLMRGYEELTGKSALEIVRWASEHAVPAQATGRVPMQVPRGIHDGGRVTALPLRPRREAWREETGARSPLRSATQACEARNRAGSPERSPDPEAVRTPDRSTRSASRSRPRGHR